MVRAFFPKAAVLLVLILLLATPAAQATESGMVFVQVWSLLTRVWASNGCGIDPSGRCEGVTADPDNGCGLDPDGRCRPAQIVTAESDNGCGIDPNGGCGR